ncbi:uncharacterized protein LOC115739805 [Rhodamnia argentea]|uniref:Uncharacterized protein LOC115739805 n=1 Tax=Rhodamnia argentea TaxID=178133 RepID=A0ABM3HXZ9_9MYRT|nr:uncharacterized protein LOC115739805 [Rhodamnia argentea]XP_030528939.2 uncharacterized protein LOC115739805 [Rhodamnia argentea]XP_030528940.2 uncharacterized protein LOC115739805 [Rhodamnia argentea]XP_048141472.1 uncharacterized protein LOC115739805 [Rhodamnia argentea]XP_048141473.1 uncharacterized protein LOC115739805 [Rhodamnia argentea]XP_048141474.1 uncharacterized protein LOC115739805 [Rhodamnia argentea]
MTDRQESSPATSSRPPPPSAEVPSGEPHAQEFSGHRIKYPNRPDAANPDPVTLREQWRFAIRQYSRWYSHAWGTAILAGAAFFALGWFIKGGNPLPSIGDDSHAPSTHPSDADSPKKDASEKASV